MFALDVGSEITPQTIYVTVEAGQDGIIPIAQGAGGPSVNRRLFGSPTPQPSPHHRIRTTTTTVPLRGLTDDESEAALKPSRRRRSSSARPGTPATATSAAKRRKAKNSTPQKTKKQREARMPSSDILQTEIPAKLGQPTLRRGPGRPPKRKRPEDAPSEQGGSGLTENPRRGKRRRSLPPDEVATLFSNANDLPDELDVTGNDRSKSPDPAQNSASRPAAANDDNVREDAAEAGIQEEEEDHDILINDILNNILSGRNQSVQGDEENDKDGLSNSVHAAAPDGSPSFFDGGVYLDGGSDDYAPIMEHDDRSDAESHTSAIQMETEHQSSETVYQGPWPAESDNNVLISREGPQNIARSSSGERSSRRGDDLDKTLDPESFTMIGIDSMPSLRQSRRLSPSDPPELGEETSFFINKTLQSLREEIAGSDDDDVDILVSRDLTPAETERHTRKTKTSSSQHQAHFTRSPAVASSCRTPRNRREITSSTGSVVGKESVSESRPASAQERLSDTDRWPEVNVIGYAEDSFSDIPEEALAAAEKQEEFRLPSIRAAEDLVAPEPSPANEASYSVAQPSHGIGGESSNRPASSHSTPPRGDRIGSNGNDDGSQRSIPQSTRPRRVSGQQTLQNSSPPHSVRSRSDSNRLLTPPDEPSPSSQSPTSEAVAATEHAVDIVSDDIGSSPPEITLPRSNEPPVLPSRRNSDTPANRQPVTKAEQTRERPVFAIAPQPSHLGGQRPALSPVVRIGRTLQNILSDPPSPSARSSILASPFKGSVRNSSPLDGAAVDEALQNVVSANESHANSVQQSSSQLGQKAIQQTTRTWSMALAPLSQIKSLVSQGAQLFTSPHVNKPQSSDPFGPSSPSLSKRTGGTQNSSFLERVRQASHEGSAYSSRVGSRDGVDDNDERYRTVCKADDSFNRRSGQSHTPLADQIGFSNHAQQPAGMATGLDGTHDTRVDEDIGGSQLGTARGPRQQSAESVRDARFTAEEEDLTEHIVQDDIGHSEQSVSEDRMQSEVGLAPEEQSDEDIWTIEANRTASSPRYPDLPNETVDSFRKSGLSIDWRTRSTESLCNSQSIQSPSLKSASNLVNTTDNLEDYSLLDAHESTSPQAPAKKLALQAQKQPKRVDLSDFFSSSPNFLESQRRAKQASLATAIIKKPVAGTTKISSPERTARKVAEPVLRSSHSPSVSELPSPATKVSDKANQEPPSSTSFPVSQEHNSRNSIPRIPRQNFAARHGENDAKPFENWVVSSQIASSEPASPGRDPPQKTTTRPPDTLPESEDEGSAVGTPPNLRPLPARAASPTKSCLRSPLKPKQAGRVVDFTSSAISTTHPLQTQVRYDNRNSIMPTSQTLPPGMIHSGKENQNAMPNHANGPSSPRHKRTLNIQQQQQHSDPPLSQTRWSRKHWLLLDELMQSYKRNPLEFQLVHSDPITATSPSKRPSSSLLGKQVTFQGKETLVLEQWHLDVTDTFKKEVGGWPEEMIAKRLFALIVGEERRRLGMVPKRR